MPVAVISGATKGIGKAISVKLAAEGFDLALYSRTITDLEKLKEELSVKHPSLKILIKATDAGNENEVKSFADAVIEVFDSVDILVNNAGIYYPGNVTDEPEGHLERMIAVNLYSAYHLTRALLPLMKKKAAGHIFNMSSVAALKAYPGGGSYSISKYALQGFSDNLRDELKAYGIKVTAICPGATWSNSWSGSGVKEERIMKAEDIAAVLWTAYSLSPQAVMEQIVLRPQLGDL